MISLIHNNILVFFNSLSQTDETGGSMRFNNVDGVCDARGGVNRDQDDSITDADGNDKGLAGSVNSRL
jgi:hypothetical protein